MCRSGLIVRIDNAAHSGLKRVGSGVGSGVDVVRIDNAAHSGLKHGRYTLLTFTKESVRIDNAAHSGLKPAFDTLMPLPFGKCKNR